MAYNHPLAKVTIVIIRPYGQKESSLGKSTRHKFVQCIKISVSSNATCYLIPRAHLLTWIIFDPRINKQLQARGEMKLLIQS